MVGALGVNGEGFDVNGKRGESKVKCCGGGDQLFFFWSYSEEVY